MLVGRVIGFYFACDRREGLFHHFYWLTACILVFKLLGMHIVEGGFFTVLKLRLLLPLINLILAWYWILSPRFCYFFFLFYVNLSKILLSQFIILSVIFLLIYHFIFGILFHNFNRNFTPDKVMNPIGHPLFDRNMLVGFILPFVSNPLIHELLQPINDEAHCLLDSLGNLDVNHLVNILKIVLHWNLLCLVWTIFPIKWEIGGWFFGIYRLLFPFINIFGLLVQIVIFLPFHDFQLKFQWITTLD